MIETLTQRPSAVFLSGLLVLAAGVLVYSLDRPTETVLFLPTALSLHAGQAHLPPFLGGPLPTFLHTVAFGLMTAAFLRPGPKGWLAASAGWVVVNMVFELAQHPEFAVHTGLGLPGFFDPLDLLAAMLGGVAAFLLLWTASMQRIK